MSFNAIQPATYTALVENDGFYPELTIPDLQRIGKLDNRLPEQTLIDYLGLAMYSVNTDLLRWQCTQQSRGYYALQDVPGAMVGGQTHQVMLYKSAVYNLATARILDDFPEYAMTTNGSQSDGVERAQSKQLLAQVYYRNSQAAVRKIAGKSDTFVRLI